MKLARYLMLRVSAATLVCAVVLLGLGFTFEVIDEVGNASPGYGFGQAVWFAVLSIPAAFVRDLPLIGLLGALTGLGSLAGTSELIAARAAGLSLARLVVLSCVPGFVAGLGAIAMAEWVVPLTDRAAASYKDNALGRAANDQLVRGLWHRDGSRFVNLESAQNDQIRALRWFDFDATAALVESGAAGQGVADEDGWTLDGARIANLVDQRIQVRTDVTLTLPIQVSPVSLYQAADAGVAQRPSDLLNLYRQLERAGLSTQRAQLGLYQALLLPLLILALVFAGAGFVLGPLRSSPIGTRLFIGVVVGLGFKLLQDIAGPVTLVYGFSPLLAVVIPGALAVALGAVNLRRT
ncbi:LPS export ABC transporter permease LptG [Litorivicinus lipolyticus]|uniref:LPS export ABC transporter permease LptG n=1 Tax=Litorivicinus lipolyticus TaxID=418701 RepID=A0A5Q2QCY4_9GAMM|nr:LPS export ABC transporter permease LptG [Litorivicinus lipolyticus]QGG79700.1 LPS export ABC transporter permease LptG [Litorivicinus lipolyticus]